MNKRKWIKGYMIGLEWNRIFPYKKRNGNILIDEILLSDPEWRGYSSARLASLLKNYSDLDLTCENL
jgi:hypothetical protein